MSKKVAFYTLGCKVNQYESAAMAELFEKRGYEIVDFNTKADVYVINTCDITNESGRKSRQITRRAIRKNPSAEIVVVGCYSQLKPDQVLAIPGVSVVMGTSNRHLIVDLVEKTKSDDKPVTIVDDIKKQRTFEEIATKGHRQKTRAFLKIQDGCNMFCSYCIIPYARGPIRSRNIDNILAETDCLSKQGFKEIVLTGIHLGLYGYDFKTGQPSLLDVISKVSQVDGIERVRLSSIEPLELTDDLLKGVSKIGAFCRHFHIPLQSGSNTILKRMNRRYTTDDFQKRINHIRTIMPDVSITTDIIVGFPGESDSEFRKTERFISKLKFSKLHVFPFSPKKGTLAAKLPNQIRGDIKKDRSRKLILLSERLERDFREKFIGMEEDVLFEQEKRKNIYEGFTKNYIAVEVKSTRNLCNKIVSVRLNKNTRDFILGEIKDQYLFKEGNKPANVE